MNLSCEYHVPIKNCFSWIGNRRPMPVGNNLASLTNWGEKFRTMYINIQINLVGQMELPETLKEN